MAITREELRVGETYDCENYFRKVIYAGADVVLYLYKDKRDDEEVECE